RLHLLLVLFFFACPAHHRDLHSFPTRRSSDLLGSVFLDFPPRRRHGRLIGDDLREERSRAFHRHLERPVINGADSDILRRGNLADRKSTRLNSSHVKISYAVFCLKKKKSNKYT